MDERRFRVGSIVEWLVAAGCIAVILAIGAPVLRDFSALPGPSPLPVAPPASLAETPIAVPERAVSVPLLVLADGRSVRVGDSEPVVNARLGSDAQIGADATERVDNRECVTRFYDYAGARFALVIEPGGDGQRRITAIYLH